MGLIIVGAAFLAGLSVSWWARSIATPQYSEAPGPPSADGVVGFPAKVDAVATLDAAHARTKRTELRAIAVSGARSDGTVDVSVAGRRVRYVFTSPRGEGPQPPRPPGTLPMRSYCGKQNVHVRTEGMVADPDQPTAACLSFGDPLPLPRCGPREVWQTAIHRGVPADQLANLQYFRATAGPAWRFEIPGTPHHFVLYGDCERELVGAEAAGSVP
jgi:hypothetical protein